MINNSGQLPKKRVKSKKKEVKFTLPILNTPVVQPNHVTNARYKYNLIQERMFTAIMLYLQKPMKDFLNTKDPLQLSIFRENLDSQYQIKIAIPLKEITSPENYSRILPAARKMVETSISFPKILDNGEEVTEVFGLIKKATVPKVGTKSSHIELVMDREVAEILISLKTRDGSHPIEYTRYTYEIAQSAKSKYTSVIYKKISSWKKKGGFKIALINLYNDICVGGIYLNENGTIRYKDFKRKVLEVARNELFKQADVWFEYSEEYEGRRVKNIIFKIITPEVIEDLEEKKVYIKTLLTRHLKLKEKDLKMLIPCFNDENFEYTSFATKIHDLIQYIYDREVDGNPVNFPRIYAVKSILKHFKINENEILE